MFHWHCEVLQGLLDGDFMDSPMKKDAQYHLRVLQARVRGAIDTIKMLKPDYMPKSTSVPAESVWGLFFEFVIAASGAKEIGKRHRNRASRLTDDLMEGRFSLRQHLAVKSNGFLNAKENRTLIEEAKLDLRGIWIQLANKTYEQKV